MALNKSFPLDPGWHGREGVQSRLHCDVILGLIGVFGHVVRADGLQFSQIVVEILLRTADVVVVVGCRHAVVVVIGVGFHDGVIGHAHLPNDGGYDVGSQVLKVVVQLGSVVTNFSVLLQKNGKYYLLTFHKSQTCSIVLPSRLECLDQSQT